MHARFRRARLPHGVNASSVEEFGRTEMLSLLRGQNVEEMLRTVLADA